MDINYLPSQIEYSYNHLYLPTYPYKSNMIPNPNNWGTSTTGSSNFPSQFDSIQSIYDKTVTDKNNMKIRKK